MICINKVLSLFLIFVFLGCSSMVEQNENKVIVDSIPLKFVSMDKRWPDRFLPKVEGFVDGQKREFLLDTGALSSLLMLDSFSSKYKDIGNSRAKSASGKVKKCNLIQPQSLVVETQKINSPKFKRCPGRVMDILGLDFLGNWSFQIDLKNKRVNLFEALPKMEYFSLKRVKRGHMILPMKIGGNETNFLFDTGADITVIDQEYVDKHPDSFRFIRNEENEDGNGVKSPSKLYICKKIRIGKMVLENIEMSAMEYSPFFKEAVEGSPGIIGNNVIEKAKWLFNTNENKWSLIKN